MKDKKYSSDRMESPTKIAKSCADYRILSLIRLVAKVYLTLPLPHSLICYYVHILRNFYGIIGRRFTDKFNGNSVFLPAVRVRNIDGTFIFCVAVLKSEIYKGKMLSLHAKIKTMQDKNKNLKLDPNGIATGDTKEDKKQRKQFIVDFYGKWIAANPEKRLYNKSLEAFIEVRFLSLEETSGHASVSYKSTLAVAFLSEVIENALVQKDKKGNIIAEAPKPNVKNQSRFSKIYVMEYEKANFGKIKLTVGELRGSRLNIQYCISAIENG